MTNWQVTAKTIYCDSVDDEVTVMVYKNGSARCTGFRKYSQPNDITSKLMKRKSQGEKRPIKCEGEECPRVSQYKDEILGEEK